MPGRRGSGELADEGYAGGALHCDVPSASFTVGCFHVSWSLSAGCLSIVHRDRPKAILWANGPRQPFLAAGLGEANVTDRRGFFRVKEQLQKVARDQVVEAFRDDVEGLLITGSFRDEPGSTWELLLGAIDDGQLSLRARAAFGGGKPCNRLCLLLASRPEEEFFGFGAQFTHLHMKGRRVPVLSQEPGIGRGIQPLTGIMERAFGAGGAWWQTYAAAPTCMSTDLRGLCLENFEYSVFDLRPASCLRIGVFAEVLSQRLFCGADPPSLLEAYTRFSGRMRLLPDWAHQGAIIGAQGGTARVQALLEKLEKQGTPISAVWLQDWVGRRKTAAGSQLWWSWELDRELYPGWEALVAGLKEKGIRILTYLNPFLVDASQARKLDRDLYAEAKENGYLVRKEDSTPYPIANTTFSASMMDLTNPGCRTWIKEVIKSNLLGTGASGWMLDYAEALPLDTKLHSGQDPASYHNEYPIEWAKVNREAISEAGVENDALFFTRSGYHCSPRYSTCFWLGDQLTSWRQEDGIKSVVVGLLSSGFCGMSLNHGDIGGYTTTAVLPIHIPFITYRRSKELLMRWIELCAFTAIFRTHEGNVPRRNHQVGDDPATLAHFARFARIFAALAPYRSELCREASDRGLPLVRHPWLHYPDDAEARKLELQFLLGRDLMVAPVLDKGSSEVRLYLPAGTWVHLWSGQEVSLPGPEGAWCRCRAPLGYPPVFFQASSASGFSLRQALHSSDLGPPWPSEPCQVEPRASAVAAAGPRGGFCARRRKAKQVYDEDTSLAAAAASSEAAPPPPKGCSGGGEELV